MQTRDGSGEVKFEVLTTAESSARQKVLAKEYAQAVRQYRKMKSQAKKNGEKLDDIRAPKKPIFRRLKTVRGVPSAEKYAEQYKKRWDAKIERRDAKKAEDVGVAGDGAGTTTKYYVVKITDGSGQVEYSVKNRSELKQWKTDNARTYARVFSEWQRSKDEAIKAGKKFTEKKPNEPELLTVKVVGTEKRAQAEAERHQKKWDERQK